MVSVVSNGASGFISSSSLVSQCLLLFLLSTAASFVSALPQEATVLLSFKKGLIDPKGYLDDWHAPFNASPCSWTGVRCNASSQHVTGLDFSNMSISGQISNVICQLQNLTSLSFNMNEFEATFPTGLLECSQLKTLDLSQNIFYGPLPSDISRLKALQNLDLSSNNFSGPIPMGVGELSQLTQLYLYMNFLNGTIPSFLGQLLELQYLLLAYNPFDPGPIPPELGNLTQLHQLWLANCSLTGPIPSSLGGLKSMQNLDLSKNNLIGNIPRRISDLTNLSQLELYQNALSGEIPSNIGNLTALMYLDMSTNQLTGRIPDGVGELKNLLSLHLYENQLDGGIPAGIANLPRMQALLLWSNRFSGVVPQSLGIASPLVTVDISQNSLSGPLPSNICKNGQLIWLAFLSNNLNGTIPESYGKCRSLLRLRLSNNQLTGQVPRALWGLPAINLLDLSNNSLEGNVSSEIGLAANLSGLTIDTNVFSGSLPAEIGNLRNLSLIQAFQNRLCGVLPITLGNLPSLSSLYLQENLISGEIPVELSFCRLLSQINLSSNLLSGYIPSALGSLPALNVLDLSHNNLTGEIPSALGKLRLTELNVSYNQLSGPVPEALLNGAFNTSFLGNQHLCGQNLLDVSPCSSEHKDRINLKLLVSTLVVVGLVIILALAYCYTRYVRSKHTQKTDKSAWDLTSFHRHGFSEYEILDKLDEENMIGCGGAGKVYKIVLSTGHTVAVKQLQAVGKHKFRHDSGFKAEVETLGKIRHNNIVKLFCCCSSKEWNLLVYEYFVNGSLGDLLHSPKGSVLDWPTRYKIALGAAQGLSYLHHGCSPPIVHRDVKSNNILVDAEYEAHIADFGLAKTMHSTIKGDSVTGIVGSFGYIAPEQSYSLKVTEKTDIYSFGVVLLELVTGRRPVEPCFGEATDIVKWVCNKIHMQNGLLEVLDPRIAADSAKDEMMMVLRAAVLCTSMQPTHRPTMQEVLEMLFDANSQHLNKSGRINRTKSYMLTEFKTHDSFRFL